MAVKNIKRRTFIKSASMVTLAGTLPALPATVAAATTSEPYTDGQRIYFINDGIFYRPAEFIQTLEQIQQQKPIVRDFYGEDGTLKELLDKCCAITGKEAAVFMPSGTLANQLAIKVLSGEKPKVLVQDSGHIYRDEADAAPTIFNKRLIPLGKGTAGFTLDEVKAAVSYNEREEVFKAEVGALAIETPVRRYTNAAIPLKDIEAITAYCREKGIKTHLDGARLHIATAHTGHTILDYAKNFDTVYLCLYKYLGAQGGAILCGKKEVIDQMHHLVKVYGGSMFTNWANAAMALHHLQDIDQVLKDAIVKGKSLIQELNKIKGIKITEAESGTNIHELRFAPGIDTVKFGKYMREEHGIIVAQPEENGFSRFTINITLLRRDNAPIVASFRKGLA